MAAKKKKKASKKKASKKKTKVSKKKVTKRAPAKKKKKAQAKKKPTAKPAAAPKPAAPKPAAAKPAAAKPAAAKPAAAKPAATPAASLAPSSMDFPAEVAAFCAAINGGGHDLDMEGYESFNEQYKPGDWSRNPDTNGLMLTFCMDGAGGQFTLWLQPGKALLDNPVVQLGDDGELHVLASDFASFCALTAAGVNFFERGTDDLTPAAPVQAMVASTWPGRSFPSAAEIMSSAQAAYPGFEAWMRAQVKS